MSLKSAWVLLSGTCLLWTACGPAGPSETPPDRQEEVVSEEQDRLESLGRGSHAQQCRPPAFVADLTPGMAGSDIRATVDFNGMVLVNVYASPTHSDLWKLVQRHGGRSKKPRWEAVLLHRFGSFPLTFQATLGQTIYFTADDGVHGIELWKTDGTPERTTMVEDIYPGSGSASPGSFTEVDGVLYFTADDGVHGHELWRSDGTHRGTRLVEDINPGSADSWLSEPMKLGSDRLIFFADDGVHGREPWVSDGTHRGTRLVEDIMPGPGTSQPTSAARLSDTEIFFFADDGVHGREPWKSDATCRGTVLIEDIRPGSLGSEPSEAFPVHGMLYFSADDGTHGRELWRSDGSHRETRLVEDINPGTASSRPGSLAMVDHKLFFLADDGVHGIEPWVSNGRASGTRMLGDFNAGPLLFGGPAFSAGDKVYFFFLTPEYGHELWVSDGTPEGTHILKDINPGPANAFAADPNTPAIVEGGIVTDAGDGVHGRELWWSNGTEEGTSMADIYPGAEWGYPYGYTRSGQWIYFSADDGVHGREVWALPVACVRSPEDWR